MLTKTSSRSFKRPKHKALKSVLSNQPMISENYRKASLYFTPREIHINVLSDSVDRMVTFHNCPEQTAGDGFWQTNCTKVRGSIPRCSAQYVRILSERIWTALHWHGSACVLPSSLLLIRSAKLCGTNKSVMKQVKLTVVRCVLRLYVNRLRPVLHSGVPILKVRSVDSFAVDISFPTILCDTRHSTRHFLLYE